LLGYRKDVVELCKAADMFVFPSYREGLSLSVMEAMASGLPCTVSEIRGNIDLIDERGGTLFDPHSVEECKNAVEKLIQMDTQAMGRWNQERVKEFELKNVLKIMNGIYREAENE